MTAHHMLVYGCEEPGRVGGRTVRKGYERGGGIPG